MTLPEEVSDEQWLLVDEVKQDLRTYVDMILTCEKTKIFEDDFTNYLALWCALLGILSWESYDSIILLLKAQKPRSAYMLSRTLFDYCVRLTYYHEQAKPIMLEWRSNPKKNLRNGLRKIHACQDWFNVDAKMANYLNLKESDLSHLTSKEMREIGKKLEKAHEEIIVRQFPYMLKIAFPDHAHPDHEKLRNILYAEWLNRSAYLHGDPLARIDFLKEHFENKNYSYESLFDESGISSVSLLTISTHLVLGMMRKFSEITDRSYAFPIHMRRMSTVFPQNNT